MKNLKIDKATQEWALNTFEKRNPRLVLREMESTGDEADRDMQNLELRARFKDGTVQLCVLYNNRLYEI